MARWPTRGSLTFDTETLHKGRDFSQIDGLNAENTMPDGNTISEEKKITLSEGASQRINELIATEGKDAMMMRVTVNGGGCSGFTYSFDMDDKTNDDDLVFERDGARVVIDEMSLGFLLDAELDYVEDLIGSSFTFKNPNAASTCGCGSSFSI